MIHAPVTMRKFLVSLPNEVTAIKKKKNKRHRFYKTPDSTQVTDESVLKSYWVNPLLNMKALLQTGSYSFYR